MDNKDMSKLVLRLNQLEEKVLELEDKLRKTQQELKEIKMVTQK